MYSVFKYPAIPSIILCHTRRLIHEPSSSFPPCLLVPYVQHPSSHLFIVLCVNKPSQAYLSNSTWAVPVMYSVVVILPAQPFSVSPQQVSLPSFTCAAMILSQIISDTCLHLLHITCAVVFISVVCSLLLLDIWPQEFKLYLNWYMYMSLLHWLSFLLSSEHTSTFPGNPPAPYSQYRCPQRFLPDLICQDVCYQCKQKGGGLWCNPTSTLNPPVSLSLYMSCTNHSWQPQFLSCECGPACFLYTHKCTVRLFLIISTFSPSTYLHLASLTVQDWLTQWS